MMVISITRISIGLLLIFSGIMKWKNGTDWLYRKVMSFEVVSPDFARWATTVMPGVEVALGTLYLLNILPIETSYMIITLLSIYTTGVAVAIRRDLDINCGCFGEKSSRIHHSIIYRNIALIFLAMCIARAVISSRS